MGNARHHPSGEEVFRRTDKISQSIIKWKKSYGEKNDWKYEQTKLIYFKKRSKKKKWKGNWWNEKGKKNR